MSQSRNVWFPETHRVWNQNTGRQGEWQFSMFEIPAHVARDGYKIQFVAESSGPGYIAVDDLTFMSGPCNQASLERTVRY